MTESNEADHCEIRQNLSRFTSALKKRYSKVSRNQELLCSTNKCWLDQEIIIRKKCNAPAFSKKNAKKRGRPSKTFGESSDRSKRRKTQHLRKDIDLEQIKFATQMKLRESDAPKITNAKTVPVDKAVAMMVDAGLSKNQYLLIKSLTKECGCDVFPSYYKVKEAKEKCYPPIEVSETRGAVKLQDQLNHTVQRIMLYQQDVFDNKNFNSNNLTLISKWGCDGTNGTMYKQTFQNETDTDEYIFLTSFVPLELKTEDETVIWRNPRPSSPRFCRPLRLEFIHETVEVTVNEVTRVENEIKNLVPTEYNGFEISHILIFSMIDGKVCNSVTSTKSAQRCYLCSLTSKDFNDLEKVKQTEINEEATKFGLSTLHGWIRIFENLLHLSYKLSIRKWQARSQEEKSEVAEQKKKIQREFRLKLGLVVDKPKQSFGTSNDGNTARRFFENAEISSEITKIDKCLISKLHVILQAISCGHPINLEKFQAYTDEAAKMYVDLFEWYPMSTTMHKLLMHSVPVMKSCILPIGMLSEEAQEARNKDIRKYRENFARKCSRKRNMEDVMKRLLLSSDPYISQQSSSKNVSKKKYSQELINLLL